MTRRRAMGGHQSARPKTTTWLTPPEIIMALGGWQSFDLDPCAAPLPRPWPTARRMNAQQDANGLAIEWDGRVWMNPPYTSAALRRWLQKLAGHNHGTALIFARTETIAFERFVWAQASALLFIHGRLHFHDARGIRADANAGAPSVLCAYGTEDLNRLAASDIDGTFVPLIFPRFMVVAAPDASWATILRDWMRRQPGPVRVADAYRYIARHPKARRNPNWRAKVRQKLPLVARRVRRDCYVAEAVC